MPEQSFRAACFSTSTYFKLKVFVALFSMVGYQLVFSEYYYHYWFVYLFLVKAFI